MNAWFLDSELSTCFQLLTGTKTDEYHKQYSTCFLILLNNKIFSHVITLDD